MHPVVACRMWASRASPTDDIDPRDERRAPNLRGDTIACPIPRSAPEGRDDYRARSFPAVAAHGTQARQKTVFVAPPRAPAEHRRPDAVDFGRGCVRPRHDADGRLRGRTIVVDALHAEDDEPSDDRGCRPRARLKHGCGGGGTDHPPGDPADENREAEGRDPCAQEKRSRDAPESTDQPPGR